MKTNARNLVVLTATIIAFAVTGCSSTRSVAVTEAPPAPQQEAMTAPPDIDSVWASGHWAWEGHWVWQSGHWMRRPHSRSIWEPGQWEQTKRGWVWRDGRWQDIGVR